MAEGESATLPCCPHWPRAPPSELVLTVLTDLPRLPCLLFLPTYRVAAVLVDDDPVRKCLIVGLDVQSAISRIQGVFLDKINVIDSCNL